MRKRLRVVIPAHDEQSVVGDLVSDLRSQGFSPPPPIRCGCWPTVAQTTRRRRRAMPELRWWNAVWGLTARENF